MRLIQSLISEINYKRIGRPNQQKQNWGNRQVSLRDFFTKRNDYNALIGVLEDKHSPSSGNLLTK